MNDVCSKMLGTLSEMLIRVAFSGIARTLRAIHVKTFKGGDI